METLPTAYRPSLFDCTTCDCPVAALVTVTLAPGTTAPAGSVTEPLSWPNCVCANDHGVMIVTINNTANTAQVLLYERLNLHSIAFLLNKLLCLEQGSTEPEA